MVSDKYVGVVIGAKGETIRALEDEFGVKIIVRGYFRRAASLERCYSMWGT